MGRPKQSVIRDHQLNLSLTQAEFEQLRSRADAVGLRLVAYGRALLLRERAVLAAAERRSGPERLVQAQLRRVGNNLNQLVRHLHMTKEPVPSDLETLLRDIREALERART